MKPTSVLTFAAVGLLLGGAVLVALKLAKRDSGEQGQPDTNVGVDPIEWGKTPMPVLKTEIDKHVVRIDPIERRGTGPVLVDPPAQEQVTRVVVNMPVLKQALAVVQQPTPQPVIQRSPDWEPPAARRGD